MGNVNIIGSGMAGLSAAISLSEKGIGCNLISVLPSERAQSVLAEGGINAALNNMDDGDTPALHASDTMEAGVLLADSEAVKGLAETAPAIVRQLAVCGVPFNTRDGRLQQRPFGGQTKVRTVFSRSSTGKVVMTALIDKVRYYESAGLVRRFPHHGLAELSISDGRCKGVWIEDEYTGSETYLAGPVILAFGGMNGLFPGMTTGTTANSGNALAQVFSQGVALSNLEMIQFHPTTIAINDKRCLVSEAARGEGGRLFILRDGKPWYFMEERYPVLKNLMPRDVVSREIYFVTHDESCTGPVYLDMTGLPDEVWRAKLPDLRKEIVEYTKLDPKTEPIPIAPGIHYFMGGIDVDAKHRTNMEGLYAAGECCSQYHGANRLGGNSMLGAMYGGHVAAESCADMLKDGMLVDAEPLHGRTLRMATPSITEKVRCILERSTGIVRDEESLQSALSELKQMISDIPDNSIDSKRILIAQAIVCSALLRKESRGAHYRRDYPERNESMCRLTLSTLRGKEVEVGFKD